MLTLFERRPHHHTHGIFAPLCADAIQFTLFSYTRHTSNICALIYIKSSISLVLVIGITVKGLELR